MSNKSTSSSGGIGCLGVLGIVFVVLKLVGVIDWSWFWVLSPYWGSCLIGLVVLGMIGIGYFVVYISRQKKGSEKWM